MEKFEETRSLIEIERRKIQVKVETERRKECEVVDIGRVKGHQRVLLYGRRDGRVHDRETVERELKGEL